VSRRNIFPTNPIILVRRRKILGRGGRRYLANGADNEPLFNPEAEKKSYRRANMRSEFSGSGAAHRAALRIASAISAFQSGSCHPVGRSNIVDVARRSEYHARTTLSYLGARRWQTRWMRFPVVCDVAQLALHD
jgi:hypothetical protein